MLLSTREVIKKLQIKKPQLYYLRNINEDFPKPIKKGNANFYNEKEIETWIDGRVGGQGLIESDKDIDRVSSDIEMIEKSIERGLVALTAIKNKYSQPNNSADIDAKIKSVEDKLNRKIDEVHKSFDIRLQHYKKQMGEMPIRLQREIDIIEKSCAINIESNKDTKEYILMTKNQLSSRMDRIESYYETLAQKIVKEDEENRESLSSLISQFKQALNQNPTQRGNDD